MKIIALVSCAKLKERISCKASVMYKKSELFKYSYQWAKLHADEVYILSSKYGLLKEDEIIETYDETLKDKGFWERKIWSESVAYNLSKISNLQKDKYLILAGKDYYENLIKEVDNYELPLGTLRYSERIEYLKSELKIDNSNNKLNVKNGNILSGSTNKSKELHSLFNGLTRYDYSNIDEIHFNNGIYIVFEENEKYGMLDRIVRVGTHRSDDRLKIRLKQHFTNKNKDDSIFRKNIGRAILSYNRDNYLDIWNIDFKKRDIKEDNEHLRDSEKESLLEERITKYMQNKLKFVCIEVKSKEDRLRLEEGIIATLNYDEDFISSPKWAGKYSPIYRIRESGMWLVQGLDGIELNHEEMDKIKELCLNNKERANNSSDKMYSNSNIKNNYSEIIRKYMIDEMNNAILKGDEYIVFTSGEINNRLGFSVHRCAQISKIMWQFKREKDEVLNTTPSGISSTIKIKYSLK